jgi:hypothetical protein
MVSRNGWPNSVTTHWTTAICPTVTARMFFQAVKPPSKPRSRPTLTTRSLTTFKSFQRSDGRVRKLTQGTLTEFFRAQGFNAGETSIVKYRFQCWLYASPHVLTPLSTSRKAGHVYDFDALAVPWRAYKAMRESKGLGFVGLVALAVLQGFQPRFYPR